MSTEIQPHDITLYDGRAYAEESQFYQQKSDALLTRSDTLIMVGFNCKLSVKHGTLQVQQGSTYGQDEKVTTYYRGTCLIKKVIILSTSGNLSLESLSWCKEQGISILLLDGLGNVVYSLLPENNADAALRRCQYRASDTSLDVHIVRELIQAKTEQQISVLKVLPSHPISEGRTTLVSGQKVTLKAKGQVVYGDFIWKPFEDGLKELSHMQEIDTIRLLEARLAIAYWGLFVGVPLKWKAVDRKKIPLHWQQVTERISSLSGSRTAQNALSPFHAALNYLYAVTEHQLLQAIYQVGLDPMCGFLHSDDTQRVSLVYDLIEPLRPRIDGKVIHFFTTTTLKRGDCVAKKDGGILFNPDFIRFLVASCKLEQQESDAIVTWLKQTLLGAAL